MSTDARHRVKGRAIRPAGRAAPFAAGLAACVALAATTDAQEQTELERGRAIVRSVCAACHTEHPPAKAAPPLAQVSMHYRRAVTDSADAVRRIAAWIAAPQAERSLLPRHAVAMWGLMPPLPLPEDQRRAAAVYVWTLGGEAHGRHTPSRRPPEPRGPHE